MSCVRSKKVLTSLTDTFGTQDLSGGARIFIVDTNSLLIVGPEVIIAAYAKPGGAQDLNISASSQVIDAEGLITIGSE